MSRQPEKLPDARAAPPSAGTEISPIRFMGRTAGLVCTMHYSTSQKSEATLATTYKMKTPKNRHFPIRVSEVGLKGTRNCPGPAGQHTQRVVESRPVMVERPFSETMVDRLPRRKVGQQKAPRKAAPNHLTTYKMHPGCIVRQ